MDTLLRRERHCRMCKPGIAGVVLVCQYLQDFQSTEISTVSHHVLRCRFNLRGALKSTSIDINFLTNKLHNAFCITSLMFQKHLQLNATKAKWKCI